MATIRDSSKAQRARRLPYLFHAAALFAIFAFAAPAQAEVHPQGRGNIDPYAIGVIIIEIMPVNPLLGLVDEMRSFDSADHYFDWVRSTFQFDEREDGTWQATFVIRGQGYAFDPSLTELRPVADPIATFIGGRTGKVQIGETEICVNAERCAGAVDPFTLASPTEEISSNSPFDQGDRSASLVYERTIMEEDDPLLGTREHARMAATTTQSSSAFRIVSWNETPRAELVCDALYPGLEESNCYWVPDANEAWIEVEGANELSVDIRRIGKVEDVRGHCYNVVDHVRGDSQENLTDLTVRVETYGWELDTSPNRFLTRPNEVQSTHHGRDESGVNTGTELHFATDIVPVCN